MYFSRENAIASSVQIKHELDKRTISITIRTLKFIENFYEESLVIDYESEGQIILNKFSSLKVSSMNNGDYICVHVTGSIDDFSITINPITLEIYNEKIVRSQYRSISQYSHVAVTTNVNILTDEEKAYRFIYESQEDTVPANEYANFIVLCFINGAEPESSISDTHYLSGHNFPLRMNIYWNDERIARTTYWNNKDIDSYLYKCYLKYGYKFDKDKQTTIKMEDDNYGRS